MSAPPKRRPADAPAVTALVELVVAQVADAVAARLGAVGPVYYDVRSIPPELGARKFLAAAQAKKFPSFLVGNRVVARRVDVHRWMESEPFVSKAKAKAKPRKKAKARKARPADALDARLGRAGLVPGDESGES